MWLMAEYIDRMAVWENACRGCTRHGDNLGECYESEPCERLLTAFGMAPAVDVAPAPRWISVNERLPEDERKRVLVLLDSAKLKKLIGEPEIDTDRVVDGRWVRWDESVTHWMPLPEPPEVEV